MSNVALHKGHSCVGGGGVLSSVGGVSVGGECGIMTACSHVLSTVGSKDKKSSFVCGSVKMSKNLYWSG